MIRNGAIIAGMTSTQPIPLLDIPFQATIQAGLVMRIAAAYGYAPTGGLSRELITTILSSLLLRYLGQTVLKFIPFLGWVASGLIGGSAVWLIGEAAIRYYENDAQVPFGTVLQKLRGNGRWRPMRRYRQMRRSAGERPVSFTPPSGKGLASHAGLEAEEVEPVGFEPEYDVPPLVLPIVDQSEIPIQAETETETKKEAGDETDAESKSDREL